MQDSLLLYDQLYDFFNMNNNIHSFLTLELDTDVELKNKFLSILEQFDKETYLNIFHLLEYIKTIETSSQDRSDIKERLIESLIYHDIINKRYLLINLYIYINNIITLLQLFNKIYVYYDETKFFKSFNTSDSLYENKEYLNKLMAKLRQTTYQSMLRITLNVFIKSIYIRYSNLLQGTKTNVYIIPYVNTSDFNIISQDDLSKTPKQLDIKGGGKKVKTKKKI
jgi:hypothetical protein